MTSSDGGTTRGDDQPRSGPRATYPTTERSPASRRRWFIGLSTLVVVAGVVLAVLGWSKFGSEDVSGDVTGYELIDDHTVAVQFTVTRSDPGRAVACVIRGRSKDGSETGRREVLIKPGTANQVGARAEVQTSAPPVIGEVFGCSTDVPSYLTVADVAVSES
ncbi:DUF4307 domain-containing protein [Gordonia sp. ABSL1-1]|uniref:DUF4307 domain-containing protein n=1 Tax=Gordonia sp. ABSL1-1 TaxID=3053923 RepID=UPI002572FEAF|nr:DUF4307 domain-containing protein [Gordonia sp. ABSL1-1]MDL9938361.1 DUF4307 domain-containing protein [Gordonia sp. ABSL1-1]